MRAIFLNVFVISTICLLPLFKDELCLIGEQVLKKEYTRFEKARIIGARALQISMGAPTLIKIPKNVIFPIDIAMLEFKENAIPITVKRNEE